MNRRDTILVADDVEINRAVLRSILRRITTCWRRRTANRLCF